MRLFKILVAATLLAAPAPLLAQQLPADVTAAAVSGAQADDVDEGNSRLGLLGLLGLAGLLGLFRREPNIHVDARRDSRP